MRLFLCHGGKLQCYDMFAYCCLFVLACLPQLVFILAFSAIGYGEHFWSYLRDRHEYFTSFCGAGATLLLALYLLDFTYWEGRAATVRSFLCAIVVAAIMVGAGLSAREFPSTPMLVFVCGGNLLFWLVRSWPPFAHLRHPQFLLGLAYSLATAATGTFAVWAYWVLEEEESSLP